MPGRAAASIVTWRPLGRSGHTPEAGPVPESGASSRPPASNGPPTLALAPEPGPPGRCGPCSLAWPPPGAGPADLLPSRRVAQVPGPATGLRWARPGHCRRTPQTAAIGILGGRLPTASGERLAARPSAPPRKRGGARLAPLASAAAARRKGRGVEVLGPSPGPDSSYGERRPTARRSESRPARDRAGRAAAMPGYAPAASDCAASQLPA